MLIEVNANRTDGLVLVILIGKLPTSDEITELGRYPGTGLLPARIYLGIRRKPGHENSYCLPGKGEFWNISTVIPDNYSRFVEIFVNDQLVRRVRVIEFTGHGSYFNH